MTELVDIKQKREYKQQELVRELAREIRDRGYENGQHEFHILSVFIALTKNLRIRIATRQEIPYSEQTRRETWEVNLVMPLLEKIFAFKLVDSEVEYLEYLLAEELWDTVASEATRQYCHESIHEPEKVFGLSPLK